MLKKPDKNSYNYCACDGWNACWDEWEEYHNRKLMEMYGSSFVTVDDHVKKVNAVTDLAKRFYQSEYAGDPDYFERDFQRHLHKALNEIR